MLAPINFKNLVTIQVGYSYRQTNNPTLPLPTGEGIIFISEILLRPGIKIISPLYVIRTNSGASNQAKPARVNSYKIFN
jgi:hypothetical protein